MAKKNNSRIKKYLTLTIFLFIIFSLSACSERRQTKNNETGPKFDNQGRRMLDFGQPDEQPSIRGLVTKIVGNEVTVLKIERPEGAGFGGVRDSSEIDGDKAPSTLGATGSRIPGMGGGRMGGMNRDNVDQDAMIERMKEMSTGEETIIIPVGIQMLKPDPVSKDEPKMIEASLGDIKKDAMISVWLNEAVTDKEVASFVLVR